MMLVKQMKGEEAANGEHENDGGKDEEDEEEGDELTEEQLMKRMLGFASFESTKASDSIVRFSPVVRSV